MTRASWQRDAEDLTADPGRAGSFLTVARLSDAIGLSVGTIKDSITRRPITKKINPRSAICRPAARIGDVPLWTSKQAKEFLKIQEQRRIAAEEAKKNPLPAITATEARKRKLFSFVEYAEMLDVHDQTLRRALAQDELFPDAVARLKSSLAGVPEHLFPLDGVTAWADSQGYTVKPLVNA